MAISNLANGGLVLAVDGKLVGLISLRDEIRPEAAEAVAMLRQTVDQMVATADVSGGEGEAV